MVICQSKKRALYLIITLTLLASIAAAAGGSEKPKTLMVCPSSCKYNCIQDAIDSANPGDKVQVKSGTYQENLQIDKDLILVGKDVRIAGEEGEEPAILIGPSEVEVEVAGLTLTLSAHSELFPHFSGIVVTGNSKATIDSTKIHTSGAAGYGIRLLDTSEAVITNSKVSLITFGIFLSYLSCATIEHNVLRDTLFGIAIGIQSCLSNEGIPKKFEGKIKGKDNLFKGELTKRPFCPKALSFLATKSGGEYP